MARQEYLCRACGGIELLELCYPFFGPIAIRICNRVNGKSYLAVLSVAPLDILERDLEANRYDGMARLVASDLSCLLGRDLPWFRRFHF
jgi:hypothetical protein